MEYELRKNIYDLRKNIFNQYLDLIEESSTSEFEIIESMLGILLSYNILFPNVNDILYEIDETSYYNFQKLLKEKDAILELALNLKKEIIEKLGYNEEFLNLHEDIDYKQQYNKDADLIEILYSKLKILLSDCDVLKLILLKYKDLKFENIDPLLKKLNDFYIEYEEIYANYLEVDIEDEDSDDYDSEYEYDSDIEDEVEEELEEKWENICNFNYDISFIDDIYCYIFNEINDEQRLLIGIMIADFYEYHKCNKKMYTRPDNADILDTIDYIENHTPDELVQYFLQQPTWACFIIDTYVYYNTNFTSEQKLDNRITIKNIGKLNILKDNNKFMDDTLKDESLYNIFMTPIGELIRSLNYSIFYMIELTDNLHTNDLFFKYFTSDFVPEEITDGIPEEIKNIDIKTLKFLQLKFIISDFFTRKLSENDKNIEMLLKFGNTTEIYNAIVSDENILKPILKDFAENIEKDDKINLNKEQKQKIIKFNILSTFDNF